MGSRLTFEEGTHTYRLDGRVVPSVTQILKAVYPNVYSGIPPHVLDRKARLGTAVHKAIELELAGRLDWDGLHAEVRPYVESWLLWWNELDIGGFESEAQRYSPLGYAMTRDFLGTINGHKWLIDWKITSHHTPTHDLQLTGYSLATADNIDVVGCLYLNPTPSSPATFRVVDTAMRLPDWMATLRVYHLMEKMK